MNGYEAYKYTDQPVYIYGDPAGLYGVGDNLRLSTYEVIRQVLIDHGFKVKVMMERPPKNMIDPKRSMGVKIPVSERIECVNSILCSGEDPPLVRLKINPHCENLIKSLSELEFTQDGKNIDKSVDKKAGRSTNKDKAHLMSHPTDSLGYLIYKRFPILKKKRGVIYFQFPGDSITEFRGRATQTIQADLYKKRIEEAKERKRLKKEEKEKEKDIKKNSLKNFLQDNGLWGNPWL